MTESPSRTIEYQPTHARRGAPRLIRVGAWAALAADLALLVAVFIENGGHLWGPYLYPPVTVFWAEPIAAVSLPLGLVGVFSSGVGVVRASPAGWKIAAALASGAYLIGVVCVVAFGLL